jgi:hypothetical protein
MLKQQFFMGLVLLLSSSFLISAQEESKVHKPAQQEEQQQLHQQVTELIKQAKENEQHILAMLARLRNSSAPKRKKR